MPVPLTIGATDSARLRALTLASAEFGGRLVPQTDPTTGECVLACHTRLIHGTGMREASVDESRRYGGGGNNSVAVASTPFHSEVWQSSQLCTLPKRCNVFWHTHPLLPVDTVLPPVARLSPPSIGDYCSHAFLGNLRNWKQQQQPNTMVVVAFEGVYEYNITPRKFRELRRVVSRALGGAPEKLELPTAVIEMVREHVFDELRDAFIDFSTDSAARARADPAHYSIAGAPRLDATRWACTTTECAMAHTDEFPLAHALRTDPTFTTDLSLFIQTNSYARRLQDLGYVYSFTPANRGPVKVSVRTR
jgi:hypothetical protein